MSKPRLNPDEALAGPLHFVAILLIGMPAIDFAMSVGAPQLGNVQWRFATVGLLSGYTLTPILGIALSLAVAAYAGQRKVQIAMMAVSLFASVVLLVLVIGFVLDLLQLRVSIPDEGQPAFRNASIRAMLKHVLAAAAFAYLGLRARRMIPERSKAKPAKTVRIVSK